MIALAHQHFSTTSFFVADVTAKMNESFATL
jgi:hypothetical protein